MFQAASWSDAILLCGKCWVISVATVTVKTMLRIPVVSSEAGQTLLHCTPQIKDDILHSVLLNFYLPSKLYAICAVCLQMQCQGICSVTVVQISTSAVCAICAKVMGIKKTRHFCCVCAVKIIHLKNQ